MTFSEQAPSRRLHMPIGEVIDIVRSGRDNGGAAFEVEAFLPPRLSGPPPHRHRRQIETFEVLDGVLRVRVGNETRDLQTGEIPDPIQRVLWRALATLPSRHGNRS